MNTANPLRDIIFAAKKQKKMKIKDCLVAVLLPAALVVSCKGGGKTEGPSIRTVKTLTVSCADSTGTLAYPGVVQEMHSINVAFKTPGQISRINVREGDYVKEGQLVAMLDDSDYELGVEALQIQYDQVSDEVSRLRELYMKKSVSANDYEKAEAGLRQLAVQLQVNKNKLAYTRLYAPVSGYVKSVNFSKSEMVDAGTPIMNILDVSGLEIQADMPASEYVDRKSFTSYSVRSADGHTVRASLVGVAPKADGNQLYRMTLLVDAGGSIMKDSFLPGTNVEVIVTKNAKAGTEDMTMLLSAICYDGGQAYVWEVGRDSALVKVNVSVSSSSDVTHILVSGIASGAEVVVAGAASLKEGEKVKALPAPSETNIGDLL